MDSAALSIPILTLSKTLKLNPNPLFYRHFSKSSLQARLFSFSRTTCISPPDFHNSRDRFLISFAASFLQKPPASVPISSRLACISSSARTEVVSGGDGNGPSGGNGSGGGDGGSDSGGLEAKSLAGESEDVSVLLPDVIILDVGGMTCGGCAASVKRILESQPQVSSASVNLATETAVVWATPEVKATQNWQQQLGVRLAQHLTNCGFKSNVRDQGSTIEAGLHS